MGEPRRPDRVAESIREQVATFLAEGAKDPRIRGFVTVTAVEMTRDLRHANVFVSVMGDEAAIKATFEGLGSVASHLRSMLGKTLRLRNAPEIHFKADESIAHASRIEQLLAQIRTDRDAVATEAVEVEAEEAEGNADSAASDDTRPPDSLQANQ
ncbi:30S ribosome-binding factor RbfA [Gemmatimonas sp.]|uniref:30S ribosome-binding factor RbfA n=1 Tax=Gemmatimonas sp. TaxID=1962908 RepID=UPI00286E1E68|nr:30S ribosome-binding factor RbfA [Gemmatimonas sp.]